MVKDNILLEKEDASKKETETKNSTSSAKPKSENKTTSKATSTKKTTAKKSNTSTKDSSTKKAETTSVKNKKVEPESKTVEFIEDFKEIKEEPSIDKNENIPTSTLKENDNQKFEQIKVSKSSKVLHIFLISLCVFLAIFLASFVCFTLINSNSTTIISGVHIHNFDVSRLKKSDALNFVNKSISNNIPEEIKLIYKDFETTIPTADLNISFDTSSAINEAYSIGRKGNLLENDIVVLQTLLSNVKITPKFTFNEEALKNTLQSLSSKLPDCAIESSYYLEGSQLILTKGRTGSVVDVDKTLESIKNQIHALDLENSIEISTLEKTPTPLDVDKIHSELYVEPKDAYFTKDPYALYPSENGIDFAITIDEVKNMLKEEKDEYEIPLKILAPKTTTNMLGREAFPDLLSTYSTKYSTRDKDRTTNLMLAANKINGLVLMPGETFSYNKTVGERTIAAGYRKAPIYVSGEVVNDVGGGICQVTTTLYNAAVYANLEIVERSNHQFVPSYAPASRDATVVYGAIDFKFKNNRNYPIKLVCSVSNGIANFQILGLKTDQDYKVEISNRVTKTTATSIYSEAYKILKQNGKTVGTYLLSKDVYKRH